MLPTLPEAEQALAFACRSNPGLWGDHSRYVAEACRNIANRAGLDSRKAYILGLLHDIGRYAGVTSERHLLDGYRFCMARGWDEAAQVCITHAFMIPDIASSIGVFDMSEADRQFLADFVRHTVYDDYDRLVQLCDGLALPTGFCLLEKRFVDVALRYGLHPATLDRWRAVLAIQKQFETKMGCSIYAVLPGAAENSLGIIPGNTERISK